MRSLGGTYWKALRGFPDNNPLTTLRLDVGLEYRVLGCTDGDRRPSTCSHSGDVASFAQTCYAARSLVNDTADQYLWLFAKTSNLTGRRSFSVECTHNSLRVVLDPPPSPEDLRAAPSLATSLDISPVGDGRVSIHEHVTTTLLHPATRPPDTRSTTTYPYLALTLDGYKNEEGESRMNPMRTRSRFRVSGLTNVITFNAMNQSRQFWDTEPYCGLEGTWAHSSLRATTLALHDGQGRREVGAGQPCAVKRFISFPSGAAYTLNSRKRFLCSHLTGIGSDAVSNYYAFNRSLKLENVTYPTLQLSHGIHDREATVVGSVYMADDGVIRWRFSSLLVCSSCMKSGDLVATSGVCV
ncbi:hypothetical protein HD554DRAFT_1332706 [Boletus coccyginus]|nr:hypothetical protein HD554DRAFT_1332706 [Boletus coccyginus]